MKPSIQEEYSTLQFIAMVLLTIVMLVGVGVLLWLGKQPPGPG